MLIGYQYINGQKNSETKVNGMSHPRAAMLSAFLCYKILERFYRFIKKAKQSVYIIPVNWLGHRLSCNSKDKEYLVRIVIYYMTIKI